MISAANSYSFPALWAKSAPPASAGKAAFNPVVATLPAPQAAVSISQDASARSSGFGGVSYASIEVGYDATNQERRKNGLDEQLLAPFLAARDDFLAIARNAVDTGGIENPKAFVASLSGQELETLRVANSLADPIKPSGLSEEGAFNLLVSMKQARDVDHDGITQVGLANTISFPPYDAPQGFKDASETTTKDMDWSTRDHLS